MDKTDIKFFRAITSLSYCVFHLMCFSLKFAFLKHLNVCEVAPSLRPTDNTSKLQIVAR